MHLRTHRYRRSEGWGEGIEYKKEWISYTQAKRVQKAAADLAGVWAWRGPSIATPPKHLFLPLTLFCFVLQLCGLSIGVRVWRIRAGVEGRIPMDPGESEPPCSSFACSCLEPGTSSVFLSFSFSSFCLLNLLNVSRSFTPRAFSRSNLKHIYTDMQTQTRNWGIQGWTYSIRENEPRIIPLTLENPLTQSSKFAHRSKVCVYICVVSLGFCTHR